MYALVKTGGKQYRVSKDDTILVERLAADRHCMHHQPQPA